jgi:hypothetical protein
VDNLNDIVDRAIAYTNELLQRMPTYRAAAAKGLRRLRRSLAGRAPGHPALARLDAFLETLNDGRGS